MGEEKTNEIIIVSNNMQLTDIIDNPTFENTNSLEKLEILIDLSIKVFAVEISLLTD